MFDSSERSSNASCALSSFRITRACSLAARQLAARTGAVHFADGQRRRSEGHGSFLTASPVGISHGRLEDSETTTSAPAHPRHARRSWSWWARGAPSGLLSIEGEHGPAPGGVLTHAITEDHPIVGSRGAIERDLEAGDVLSLI